MGTHPIFESDFDCLTESVIQARAQLGSLAEFERRKSEVIRQNDRRRTRAA